MRSILYIFSLCLLLAGCGHNSEIDRQIDAAEGLMLSAPDSSLHILNNIYVGDLSGKEQKARHALLKSMALDKNYIDTTTFDVLQPAIDYYLDHGTPDEKLRTLYYKGRIFQNKMEYDNAMQCFLIAEEIKDFSDTLTYGNMLIAQGTLYYATLNIDKQIKSDLEAARLYGEIGSERKQLSALIKVLNGCVTYKEQHIADSIMPIADSLATKLTQYEQLQNDLILMKVAYIHRFKSSMLLKNALDSISGIKNLPPHIKIDISFGYLDIAEPNRALDILESIDTASVSGSIKYLLLKSEVMKANGRYAEAYASLKNYCNAVENDNTAIYSDKTSVAKERYDAELRNLIDIQHKNKLIWISVCSILLLLLIIGIISYLYRLGKMKRLIAEKEQSRLQLENDNLQKQNSVLALEKQTAELETEKQHLAGENMKLRITQLEAEIEQLKDLTEKDELPDDVKEVIKKRISILNALFAANILDKEPAATAYVDLVKREISDKEKFMNSNRLAFKVSHPMFIKYLEDHGLTEYEINYLCLYAIGLKGKEVGNYMELRRHYNVSSEIRSKLGIDEHETNIGIYVRKLLKQL